MKGEALRLFHVKALRAFHIHLATHRGQVSIPRKIDACRTFAISKIISKSPKIDAQKMERQ